jgi:hypothetical protein
MKRKKENHQLCTSQTEKEKLKENKGTAAFSALLKPRPGGYQEKARKSSRRKQQHLYPHFSIPLHGLRLVIIRLRLVIT